MQQEFPLKDPQRGCEGINLNKKLNFYKNIFFVIFGVKFHPTASLGTVLHAEFQKEAIAHGPDTVAPQVS